MFERTLAKTFRIRRSVGVLVIGLLIILAHSWPLFLKSDNSLIQPLDVLSEQTLAAEKAADVLERLAVKGRATKTDYRRSQFGEGWAQVGNCDMRNIMLKRFMTEVKVSEDSCIVLSGWLDDPYTGRRIAFIRGSATSGDVQIDHVVALSDAWQKGAQQLEFELRVQFANDPLNLLPVDGDANQQKSNSDAASWLPGNKAFRCQYVARQIAVKSKYGLWVTEAEKAAMKRVLNGCADQVVPIEK